IRLSRYGIKTMFQPEDNCAICMDSLSTGPVCHPSSCRDFFHKRCLDQWLNTAKSCPCCRAVVTGTVDATASAAGAAAPSPPVPPHIEEMWTRHAANRHEQPQDLSEEEAIQIALALSLADSEEQTPIVNAVEEGDDIQLGLALSRMDDSSTRVTGRSSEVDDDIQLALAISISEAEQTNHAQATNTAEVARVPRSRAPEPEHRTHSEDDESMQLAMAMSLSEQTAAADHKKNAVEEKRLRTDVVNRSMYEDIKSLPNFENDEDLQLALALSISLAQQIDTDQKKSAAEEDTAASHQQRTIAPPTVPPTTVSYTTVTTITLATPTTPFTITIKPTPAAPSGQGSSNGEMVRPNVASSNIDISVKVADFLQTPTSTTTAQHLTVAVEEPTIAPSECPPKETEETEDEAMRFVMEMAFGLSEGTAVTAPIMSDAEEAALMRDLFGLADD
ncbi:hypothetical protein PRIPAC_88928, partial [Pristionchus pacificus]